MTGVWILWGNVSRVTSNCFCVLLDNFQKATQYTKHFAQLAQVQDGIKTKPHPFSRIHIIGNTQQTLWSVQKEAAVAQCLRQHTYTQPAWVQLPPYKSLLAKIAPMEWPLVSEWMNEWVSEWMSEWMGFNVPHQHIIGHFGDESFRSITCTGTDNLTRTTKRQNTHINKFVRPRWPYDMRPSVRAEKYIRDAGP